MARETIDLAGSSPPPSRLSASASVEKIQFKKSTLPFWANNQNPHLRYAWVPRKPCVHTYELSQIMSGFPTSMHGDDQAAAVTESNASLFPQESQLKEPWTPEEHEGLVKYGRGRCFVRNKTVQEVQSYGKSLFRHQSTAATYQYRFSKMKPSCDTAITDDLSRNGNPMGASAWYCSKPPTLMLFPVDTYRTHGFQMQTGGATTSMAATASDDAIDLELRLG